MKRALTVLCLAAGLLAFRSPAGLFSFSYSPTGIAYDAVNNLVSVSGGTQVYNYDTNGSLQTSFSGGGSITDLGAGSSGNVWAQSSSTARLYDYYGNSQALNTVPANTVALGAVTLNNTTYVMAAVQGGNVTLQDGLGNIVLTLMPTPANITGGDCILRPGGYTLDHVLIALNDLTKVRFYSWSGTNGFQNFQSLAFDASSGFGRDVSFGNGAIWVAQDLGGEGCAVPYPFTIPPVPEATVSMTISNATLLVNWTGRALQTSTNLTTWTPLTNAPQPCLLSPTNAPQFFRALK